MSSYADSLVADINVTPFVDVMLVLLIIFMVTAPMMTEGLELDLPSIKKSEVLPAEQESFILSIKNDGTLFVGDKETKLDELDTLLEAQVLADKKQLLLRADKKIEYGVVMELMSHVRSMGIENVGMITDATSGEDSSEIAEDIESGFAAKIAKN